VHTYPLASRKSKVSVRGFAKPTARMRRLQNSGITANILAAEDLRNLLRPIHIARSNAKRFSGDWRHVIKVGLGLFDRSDETRLYHWNRHERAALIHDFENRACGNTSEDVEAASAKANSHGEETGKYLNEIAKLFSPHPHRLRRSRGTISVERHSSKRNTRIPASSWALSIKSP